MKIHPKITGRVFFKYIESPFLGRAVGCVAFFPRRTNFGPKLAAGDRQQPPRRGPKRSSGPISAADSWIGPGHLNMTTVPYQSFIGALK